MGRTPHVEALFDRLARQVDELPTDSREALIRLVEVAAIEEQTAGVEGQLRERIAQLIAGGDTLAAIAGRSGLHTSPFYRWWKGETDLKLASFVRVCGAVGMVLVATSTKKGRASQ